MIERSTIVALSFVAMTMSVEAQAQTSTDRAYELFEQAEAFYAAGELELAIQRLLEARELDGNPMLLYNLARCYEGLGRLEEAAAAYREYVDEAPDAPARAAIEQRITAIEGQLEARARVERERAEERARADAAEARAERRGRDFGPWPWAVTGLGLATFLGAAITGPLALAGREDALHAPDQRAAAETFDTAYELAVATNVLLACGAVLTAVGVALVSYALATSRARRPLRGESQARRAAAASLVFR